MQKPYDVMAKGLVEGALAGPCVVRTEEEAVADARAIDAVVEPDPARIAELTGRGLLGRMAQRPCVIEAFHDPPSAEDLDECLLKVVALHARQRAAWKALPPARRGPSPVRATLWVVSAGSPDAARSAWGLEPLAGWAPGCYSAGGERGPRLAVASELPRTRDTLLARMMGAGETLRAAHDDVRALPGDAWERAVLAPLFELLRRDLSRMGIPGYSAEEEAMSVYQEALKVWAQREQELRAEGRAEALAPLMHQFERKLGRGLTGAEKATLLERLDTAGAARLGDVALDLDGAQLVAWLADPGAR